MKALKYWKGRSEAFLGKENSVGRIKRLGNARGTVMQLSSPASWSLRACVWKERRLEKWDGSRLQQASKSDYNFYKEY